MLSAYYLHTIILLSDPTVDGIDKKQLSYHRFEMEIYCYVSACEKFNQNCTKKISVHLMSIYFWHFPPLSITQTASDSVHVNETSIAYSIALNQFCLWRLL